jgi:hypothetical protein
MQKTSNSFISSEIAQDFNQSTNEMNFWIVPPLNNADDTT